MSTTTVKLTRNGSAYNAIYTGGKLTQIVKADGTVIPSTSKTFRRLADNNRGGKFNLADGRRDPNAKPALSATTPRFGGAKNRLPEPKTTFQRSVDEALDEALAYGLDLQTEVIHTTVDAAALAIGKSPNKKKLAKRRIFEFDPDRI